LPLRPRCDAALPSAALQPLLGRVQPKRRRDADRSRAPDEAVVVQAARRGARPHVRVPGGHGPRGRARRSPDAGRAGRLARVVKLCDPARDAEETRFPAASKLVFNFNSEVIKRTMSSKSALSERPASGEAAGGSRGTT